MGSDRSAGMDALMQQMQQFVDSTHMPDINRQTTCFRFMICNSRCETGCRDYVYHAMCGETYDQAMKRSDGKLSQYGAGRGSKTYPGDVWCAFLVDAMTVKPQMDCMLRGSSVDIIVKLPTLFKFFKAIKCAFPSERLDHLAMFMLAVIKPENITEIIMCDCWDLDMSCVQKRDLVKFLLCQTFDKDELAKELTFLMQNIYFKLPAPPEVCAPNPQQCEPACAQKQQPPPCVQKPQPCAPAAAPAPSQCCNDAYGYAQDVCPPPRYCSEDNEALMGLSSIQNFLAVTGFPDWVDARYIVGLFLISNLASDRVYAEIMKAQGLDESGAESQHACGLEAYRQQVISASKTCANIIPCGEWGALLSAFNYCSSRCVNVMQADTQIKTFMEMIIPSGVVRQYLMQAAAQNQHGYEDDYEHKSGCVGCSAVSIKMFLTAMLNDWADAWENMGWTVCDTLGEEVEAYKADNKEILAPAFALMMKCLSAQN